jgi:hypothetical protein
MTGRGAIGSSAQKAPDLTENMPFLTVQLLSGEQWILDLDVSTTYYQVYERLTEKYCREIGKVLLPQLNLIDDGELLPSSMECALIDSEKIYYLFVDTYTYRVKFTRMRGGDYVVGRSAQRDQLYDRFHLEIWAYHSLQKTLTNVFCEDLLYHSRDRTYLDLVGVEISDRDTFDLTEEKPHHTQDDLIVHIISRIAEPFQPSSLMGYCSIVAQLEQDFVWFTQ